MLFVVLPVFLAMAVSLLFSKQSGNKKYFLGYGFSVLLFLIFFSIESEPCNGLFCFGPHLVAFSFLIAGLASFFTFYFYTGGWGIAKKIDKWKSVKKIGGCKKIAELALIVLMSVIFIVQLGLRMMIK